MHLPDEEHCIVAVGGAAVGVAVAVVVGAAVVVADTAGGQW